LYPRPKASADIVPLVIIVGMLSHLYCVIEANTVYVALAVLVIEN
jgi:hypothetical protein